MRISFAAVETSAHDSISISMLLIWENVRMIALRDTDFCVKIPIIFLTLSICYYENDILFLRISVNTVRSLIFAFPVTTYLVTRVIEVITKESKILRISFGISNFE